ncbi:MAG TPA: sterol desaturase family protein [Stellaceae bacterium]|nr:sterol desaturase family protein [Stellaceae bacterium]
MQETLERLLALKGVLVLVWLAALFLGERLLPAAPRPTGPGWPRLCSNVIFWGLDSGLSVLAVLPVTMWAAQHALSWRPLWWGGGFGLIADLVLLDGLIYVWHRLNHRMPLLWRFHSVHHLDRFLDSTTALRFHFGEVLLSALVRAGVIVLLAFPLTSVLAFEALLLVATLFHHSNLRLAPQLERALSRVIVTPSIHWVHHHRRQSDTDSNYATVLSLWDPLFRSRSPTRRTRDLEIGVEGRDELPIWSLMWAPFASPTYAAERRAQSSRSS